MTNTADPTLSPIDDRARATLFTHARTANTFSDKPVTDEELSEIWELARWAPTSANTQPLHVVYVRTEEGKDRLVKHMSSGNQAKTRSAPANAILAADLDFHETMPRTFPIKPEMRDNFVKEEVRHPFAKYNATLQAGYFILAIRAVGLAAGPMLGFDGDGIDKEFFSGTTLSTNLVINIGHPGEKPWFDRLPRLDHEEVISWA